MATQVSASARTRLLTGRSTSGPVRASTAAAARPPADSTHPLDLWARLDIDSQLLDARLVASKPVGNRQPPIPTYVRLSRLIEHDLEPAPGRGRGGDVIDLTTTGTVTPTGERWADSVGRPLFQIGLAAMVAATAVAIFSFTPPPPEPLSTTDSPEPATDFGLDPLPEVTRFAGTDTGSAAAPLLRGQTVGPAEADLSIVGTASAGEGEIRWTATVQNEGPRTDPGPITVSHTVPRGMDLIRSGGTGWACQVDDEASTFACTLADGLGTGERRQLALVTSDLDAPAGTELPSTMSVAGAGDDPQLGNNTISVTAIALGAGPDVDDNSRSTGAASGSADEGDGSRSGAASSEDSGTVDQSDDEELPRTGAGMTLALTGVGMALCLIGRRIMRWGESHQPVVIASRLP